ncbi:MAG: hypothetical protein Q8L78_08675 [Coxiellaceae bacterium]|nr:hypothetical protein [Coxiellaceae bacterium]
MIKNLADILSRFCKNKPIEEAEKNLLKKACRNINDNFFLTPQNIVLEHNNYPTEVIPLLYALKQISSENASLFFISFLKELFSTFSVEVINHNILNVLALSGKAFIFLNDLNESRLYSIFLCEKNSERKTDFVENLIFDLLLTLLEKIKAINTSDVNNFLALKKFLFEALLTYAHFENGKKNRMVEVIEKIKNFHIFHADIKNYFLSCVEKKDLTAWVIGHPDSIDWNTYQLFLWELRDNKEYIRNTHYRLLEANLIGNLFRISRFDLSGKETDETWPLYTRYCIIPSANPTKESSVKSSVKVATLFENKIENALVFDLSKWILENNLYFHLCLGRTFIFKNAGEKYFAVKIQKQKESEHELQKEFKTTQLLQENQKEWCLKSQIPEALFFGKLDSAEFLKQYSDNDLMSHSPQPFVYIYSSSPDYFIYLSDPNLSADVFQKASRAAIYDLGKLLNRGMVYHQLADIFHNSTSGTQREDLGRYLTLAGLLRQFFINSGRVDRWTDAVAYPNVRASGLADLGDFSAKESYVQSPYLQEMKRPCPHPVKGKTFPENPYAIDFIFANLIGEYLFVFTLISGRRGRALTMNYVLSSDVKKQIWLSLAEGLLDNAALLISVLTNLDEENCKRYIQSAISKKLLAAQMEFWMTDSHATALPQNHEKYSKALQELYPGATIGWEGIHNYRVTKIGFSHDGVSPDLGDYNCQNPMKEDNKLYYLTASIIHLFKAMKHAYAKGVASFEAAFDARDIVAAKNAINLLIMNRNKKISHQRHYLRFAMMRYIIWHKTIPAGEEKIALKTSCYDHAK